MKRKKKHEDHIDESWLIPYADILTLLLALFIVLFASSKIDSEKYEELAISLNSALQGGTGVLEHGEVVNPIDDPSQIPITDEEHLIEDDDQEKETEKESTITPEQDHEKLEELQENMNGYIEKKGLTSKVDTELTVQGLLVTIKEGVLFQPGSADVDGDAKKIVEELSDILVADPPREIRIEGHTDNVPMSSAEFPSNWELSSARAINFMKLLLQNTDLKPENFSAIGYGEYRPVSSNDSAKGRAQNRRVEVMISPYQQKN